MSSSNNPSIDAKPLKPFPITEEAAKLLATNPDGTPVYLNYWPQNTGPSERILRVFAPATLAALEKEIGKGAEGYALSGDGTAVMLSSEEEETIVLRPPGERLVRLWKEVTKEFEALTGFTIATEGEMKSGDSYELVLLMYDRTADDDALAKTTKPDLSEEERNNGGTAQVPLLFDTESTKNATDEELKARIRHELAHALGIHHPFMENDPALARLTEDSLANQYRHRLSVMDYGKLDQTADAPFIGGLNALELSALRNALGKDAPKLNTGNTTYAPVAGYLTPSASETNSFATRPVLDSNGDPTLPMSLVIIDNGGRDRFILPGGDAVNALDTNPGMASLLRQELLYNAKRGDQARLVTLLEGHLEEIFIDGGKNTVTAARNGAQDFVIQGGVSEILLSPPQKGETGGRKTLVYQGGEATLTVPVSMVKTAEVATDGKGNVVLRLGDGNEIMLQADTKPARVTLQAVDDKGAALFSARLDGLKTLQDWRTNIAAPLAARAAVQNTAASLPVSLPDASTPLVFQSLPNLQARPNESPSSPVARF